MCARQHTSGPNATHLALKRALQTALTACRAPYWVNEQSYCFSRPGLRADTILAPGSLCFAGKCALGRGCGAIFDVSVRAPTAPGYLHARGGSAEVDGYAARQGEQAKLAHYRASFDASRWEFVPFVAEAHGRFGRCARAFVARLARHAAACAPRPAPSEPIHPALVVPGQPRPLALQAGPLLAP